MLKLYLLIISLLFCNVFSKQECNDNISLNNDTFILPNKGSEFEVIGHFNKILVIQIKGNPTTGYGWYLDNKNEVESSEKLKILNLNDNNSTDDYVSDPHEEGMTGYGGYYYFKFKVIKSDVEQDLVFINKRPWEKEIWRKAVIKANILN